MLGFYKISPLPVHWLLTNPRNEEYIVHSPNPQHEDYVLNLKFYPNKHTNH